MVALLPIAIFLELTSSSVEKDGRFGLYPPPPPLPHRYSISIHTNNPLHFPKVSKQKKMGLLSLSSLQIVFISSGILSLALLFRVTAPLVMDFSVNYQALNLWSSFCSWLKPPYLYVVLNCIIITIAASSRFHHSHGDDQDQHRQQEKVPTPEITVNETDLQFHDYDMKISTTAAAVAEEIRSDYGGLGLELTEALPEVYEKREMEEMVIASVFEDKRTVFVAENSVKKEDEYDFTISQSTWIPSKKIQSSENLPELLIPAEKPLVSSRFGHRKPVKGSPEGGRALRVAKPKRQETLENTWKTITEGRAMPLTRHLKKSDTFDYGRPVNGSDLNSHAPKKSETFKDRTNYQATPVNNGYSSSGGDGKLKKEPSLGQDELNRRVEAFINKFNEEMRMQRQESLNQYKEMISRGSH
ncbi:uncharacterized protein LOC126666245 [Mercurialis annua]|uniref:uncharacterized protein LOC126666245 n=1 Tax=Mercurialis annua TaxID=3986 RepID=UPI0024AFE177|nr:uncharacterized protein LOC126666245 [Mercurialis annua]